MTTLYPLIVQQKNIKCAGCWWLTPVILPTQEAEIRRIMVQNQLQKTVP
jgi:hypothetical protein